MNLKKTVENHPLYFVLAPMVPVFVTGFWIGREYLKNDLASAKIELKIENDHLKDKLKQLENCSKELSEKTKDYENRLAELNSQMMAQKNQYE